MVFSNGLNDDLVFLGQFKNVPLGNVYAEDPDDWDVPDKTFEFVADDTTKNFR